MNENKYVSIFFELYDLLKVPYTKSQIEYKMFLTEGLDNIFKALRMVSKHQENTKVQYKIIFCFGDIVQLDWKIQNALYRQCMSLNLAFGLTVKLEEKNFKYLTTLKKICSFYDKQNSLPLTDFTNTTLTEDETTPFYLKNVEQKNELPAQERHSISFYHYLDVLLLKDTRNVFNITNYTKNINTLIEQAKLHNHQVHFIIYLNKEVLAKYSPEELRKITEPFSSYYPVTLEADPNLPIIKQQFHYPYKNISHYIREFYNFAQIESYTEQFKHHFIYLKEEKKDKEKLSETIAKENIHELDNILNNNSQKFNTQKQTIIIKKENQIKKDITFFDFVETKFFIDLELNVYYSFESIYGNLSLFLNDSKLSKYMLGNLKKKPLDVILSKESLLREEVTNKFFLDNSIFNCKKCIYYKICFNNAVGLLRREHPDFEKKAGHCFGIKDF
jgi:hypothetical protein